MQIDLSGCEASGISSQLKTRGSELATGAKPDRERLKRACQDFEALMVAQMLKTMRPAEEAGEEPGGLSLGSANPLQEMFDWELARILARQSPLGIAEELLERLSQAQGEEPAPHQSADWDELIARQSSAQGVDPNLVRAVVTVESGGDPAAVSPQGAKGLMQLMDSTAAAVGVRHPFDPEENIRGGVAYLKQLLGRYQGDIKLALAAYNAGPGAVDRYGGIPPYSETREYVQRVLGLLKLDNG